MSLWQSGTGSEDATQPEDTALAGQDWPGSIPVPLAHWGREVNKPSAQPLHSLVSSSVRLSHQQLCPRVVVRSDYNN